jgi:hypothetical protein
MRPFLIPAVFLSLAAAADTTVLRIPEGNVRHITIGAPPGTPEVNLDRPGALERIARQDPALYKRLVGVIQAAEMQPCEHLPKVIEAQFKASVASCEGYNILTSFPPKIHMSFLVDGTLYVSNVQQPRLAGKLVPAAERAKPAVEVR